MGGPGNLPEETRIAGTKNPDDFFESFRFVLPGYNLRPLELSGAIGCEQVKKLDALIDGRRRNADVFQRLMANHPVLELQAEIGKK